MNRVSNRALVNFAVDAAIAAAFVVSAVSGLVFLLPARWLTLSVSTTTALGVDYATWRTLHDWTAVVMIAGVVLHTALHWRWVTTMIRRLAGSRRTGRRPAATDVPRPKAAVPVAPASQVHVPAIAAAPAFEASAGRSEPVERAGLTRHAFLKGAGTVGVAALVGGLVGRSAASAAVSWLGEGSSTSSTASTTSAAQDGAGTAGAGESAQTTTSTARVAIDAGRCTGCGKCLQVCPFGVFAASGGGVAVANADACRLCGRCIQVCPAGAITLNG
jgi:NAD-dependent dihydropyrimidine dehydrogenase PreA subunit